MKYPKRPTYLTMITMMAWGLIVLAPSVQAGSIFDDQEIPAKPVEPAHPVDQPSPATPAATPTDPKPTPPAETHAPTPAPSDRPVPPDAPPAPRPTMPAKAELTHSRQMLKVAFAEQLKDRSVPARKKLAESLIDESDKPGNSTADRFALLTGAIDAARESASLSLSARAAQKLAENFPVDDLKVQINTAEAMNLRTAAPADANDNVTAGLQLVSALAEAEEFTDSVKILSLLRPLAATNAELRAAVAKRTQLLEATRSAAERVKPSLEKLKTTPNDAGASQIVGTYYCFRLGQWDKGLPYLAKGSDAKLKQVIGDEVAAGSDPAKAMTVAGAWWDASAVKGVSDNDAKAMKLHAATWYRIAKRGAGGLDAKVVETRLAEVGKIITDGDGPISAGGGGVGPLVFVNTFGMKFVRISPGWFVMGSPLNESGRGTNEKQHKVAITHPYYICTVLVTHGQWKAVMDGDRSGLETELQPHSSISWNAAMSFCRKLSEKDGKQYRLPTEAEWEFACRAGSPAPYGGAKLDEVGWTNANAGGPKHAVATKKPNAWGLFDTHGQLWEWCSDYYGPYPDGAVVDPTGPALTDENALRVHRGGSWCDGPDCARAAAREGGKPSYGDDRYGVRICVDLTP